MTRPEPLSPIDFLSLASRKPRLPGLARRTADVEDSRIVPWAGMRLRPGSGQARW